MTGQRLGCLPPARPVPAVPGRAAGGTMGVWPAPPPVMTVMLVARPMCWPPRPRSGGRCGPRSARPGWPGSPAQQAGP